MQSFTVTKEVCGDEITFQCADHPGALPYSLLAYSPSKGESKGRYFKCEPDFFRQDVVITELTEDQYDLHQKMKYDFILAKSKEGLQ